MVLMLELMRNSVIELRYNDGSFIALCPSSASNSSFSTHTSADIMMMKHRGRTGRRRRHSRMRIGMIGMKGMKMRMKRRAGNMVTINRQMSWIRQKDLSRRTGRTTTKRRSELRRRRESIRVRVRMRRSG